jgi:hypothetical protein
MIAPLMTVDGSLQLSRAIAKTITRDGNHPHFRTRATPHWLAAIRRASQLFATTIMRQN